MALFSLGANMYAGTPDDATITPHSFMHVLLVSAIRDGDHSWGLEPPRCRQCLEHKGSITCSKHHVAQAFPEFPALSYATGESRALFLRGGQSTDMVYYEMQRLYQRRMANRPDHDIYVNANVAATFIVACEVGVGLKGPLLALAPCVEAVDADGTRLGMSAELCGMVLSFL